MEFQVLDSLDDLEYETKFDEDTLGQCLKDWSQYSKLIEWICSQLKAVTKIDEVVNSITTNEDLSSFLMELSSLLNELGCPYSAIMEGPLSSRFDSPEARLLTLNFLLSELMASRIIDADKPKQMKIELSESQEARLLREILQTLALGKPPANITIPALCSKILEKISQVLGKWKNGGVENVPIFTGVLTPKQWAQLEDLQKQFNSEYKLRREMLLKRLDVTVQSFHWSDRLQNKTEEMNSIFRERRHLLDPNPAVAISDVLAARTDLAIIEKTSSAKYRENTKSVVNSVTIGKVPDRGGRPDEAQVPAPEMPAWQQRQGGGPSGSVGWSQPQRSRGGGGGDGRGGRGGGNFRGGRGGGGGSQDYQQGGNQGYEHAGGRSGYQQIQGQQNWQQSAAGGSRGHQDYRGGQGQSWDDRGRGGSGYQDHSGGSGQGGDYGGHGHQNQRGGGRGGYGGGRGSRVQGGWSNSNY